MDKFFNSVQSFFQSVTATDRYAGAESSTSRRTASGGFGPSAPLTNSMGAPAGDDSVAASPSLYNPSGSFHNGNNPYSSNPGSRTGSFTNLSSAAAGSSTSLNRLPYTPGMRSQSTSSNSGGSGSASGINGIPLQEYSDGLPPPPPPSLSWKRIDRWLEQHYEELGDVLEENCSNRDLNEFEADIGCTLPEDVRDSFLVHDGQERGGRPTGVVFNLILLDLEAVSLEWENWKKAAQRVEVMTRAAHANKLNQHHYSNQASTSASAAGPSKRPGAFSSAGNLSWLDHQASFPEGAVQPVYAHPAWIPLVTDYLGNNIAVDLAPGPKGKWGQVILFGREYDTKYVIAPSWASFLMTFADDLENAHHIISDLTEEGELSYCSQKGIPIPYMDVLKSRTERSHRLLMRQSRQQDSKNPNHPYGIYRQSSNGSSPRNSIGSASAAAPAPAGRNVSGSYRGPSTRPARISTDNKLISPMSSSSNLALASPSSSGLPSTGLTKSPLPSVTLNSIDAVTNTSASSSSSSTTTTTILTPSNFNKTDIISPTETILEEPEPTSSTPPSPVKPELKSTPTTGAQKGEEDEKKKEPEPVKDQKSDAAATTTTAAETTTEAPAKSSEKEPDSTKDADSTTTTPTTATPDTATTTISEKSSTSSETNEASDSSKISKKTSTEKDPNEAESEDEVDLLKDELTDVAI